MPLTPGTHLGPYEIAEPLGAGGTDGDGMVSAFDLAILLGAWGPCEDCPADLNDDGEVGPADLAMLLGAWGPCGV